jgi:hypothetical protein
MVEREKSLAMLAIKAQPSNHQLVTTVIGIPCLLII